MRGPLLFGLGTATVDFRITTADLGIDYRAKLLARETTIHGGGAVANSLHQASLLGAETQWLGKLGDDGIGRTVLRELADRGVGTDYAIVAATAISPFNVAVYAGENQRRVGGFLLPNCLADLSDEDIREWCAAPKRGDWCLIEIGELPLDAVLSFCEGIQDRGIRIVLDVDLDPIAQCTGGSVAIVEHLFRCSDYILPNYDAMHSICPGLTPGDMAKEIHQESGATVVVTAGADGCYFADRGQVVHRFPPVVDVVDTVGAGDAFHGGLIRSLMNGESLSEAVDEGNACGAANCRVFGAREGMLDAASLEQFRDGLIT